MATEEEIMKQTVDANGERIPTELQIPAEATPVADTKESIEREAEDGAVDAWLTGLKDEDIPTDEKELIKFVRDNVPRLDKQDDAAVLAAWRGETAKAPTPTGEATKVEDQPWAPTGYSIYGEDGNALTEYTPEIQAFLEKSVFGYNALGREQRKSLAEVVRNASMGHLNHQRYTMLQSDVERLNAELGTATEANTKFGNQFDVYDRAIMAATQGNLDPLEALIEEAKQTPSIADPRVADLESQVAEMKQQANGQQWLNDTRPYLVDLANRYGVAQADYQAFENFTLEQINLIPMLSHEKLNSYLQHELPMALQAGGYTEGGSAPVTDGAPVVAAQTPEQTATNEANAKIQSLTAEIENMKNEKAASAATGGPPGSGPGGADAGGSGIDVPDFKSRSAAMAWLRS